MAERSDATKVPAIVWKTQRPNKDKDRVSSDFQLLGGTWRLELKMIAELNRWEIRLVNRESISPEIPFRVVTYIQMNGSSGKDLVFQSQGYETRVDSHIKTVWICDKKTASEKITHFQDYSELTVFCMPIDIPPATSTVLNDTIQVATQTDFVDTLQAKNFRDDNLSSDECEQEASYISSSLDSLSHDLGKLLQDKVLPDVSLKCGDRTAKVHKTILIARSKVFSAMFQSKMLESETGEVDISDVDAKVLELFLMYLYTGRLTDLPEDAVPSLYAAGDKYAVSALKKACSQRIISNLTEENCLNFLLLADSHSDRNLKNDILDFILNHMEILKSEEWSKFRKENLSLCSDVLQEVVEKTGFS